MSSLQSQPPLPQPKCLTGQGFGPRQRRRLSVAAPLMLASVAALSALFSPPAAAVYSLATSYDSKFVTDIQAARLTQASFQTFVCGQAASTYQYIQGASGGANGFTPTQACALVTNDPQFYSTTTPRFYKFKICNNTPSSYVIVGNLLAQTGDLRPEAKESWFGTEAVQPTPSVTYDLCTQGKPNFVSPPGFVAAASDGNYTYVDQTYGAKINDTVPQDPQRTGFAKGVLGLVLVRTNASGNAAVYPYVQQGTAVYGTDYSLDSNNGVSGTSNTITLNAIGVGAQIAPVYYKPVNHPETTLQWALTAPTGYTWIGQPLWNARINALNHSTVSVSAIGGQSTITPGSTQGGFVLTRSSGDQSVDLPVSYTIGGTAANGTDYGYLSGDATIPAGQSTLNVPIITAVPSGSTAIPQKDVLISLSAPADSSYNVPAAGASGQSNDFTIPAYSPSTVSFSQSGGGTLTPGTPQQVTVNRSGGDTTKALTVPYTVGGSAMSGSDYYALPGSVTIPAGSTTASISVAAIQQKGATAVPAKTLTLSPSTASGYTADPNAAPLTYNLPAYTPTSVSAAPGSNGSTVPQGTTGSFTITRTGDLSQALPVTYTLGGTAQNGTDYNQLPGSVTIPAGQSAVTVPVTVPTATGSTATPAKTIQVAVNSDSGYSPDSANPSTTLTIPAYTPDSVSFGTTNGGPLTPGGTSDSFTVKRSGSTTQPLTVSLATAGSATPGVDYGQLPANVTIPVGQTSVTVPLRAFAPSGTAAKPQKDVQISFQPGAGYAPGSSTPATYTIPAYTPSTGSTPAVTVSVPNGQDTLLTPGSNTDGFTVTRTGATTAPLTVAYTVGGTAQSGIDYTPLSGTVTIPAGASTATVPINVPVGATQGKTVAIGVTPGSSYSQGTNSNVTYTIGTLATAPSTSTVSLGFDSAIPAFVLTRAGGDLAKALTVPVNFGGSGVPGVDYAQLPSSVTFAAGKTSATIPVRLLPTAKTGNTIMASIPPGSGYDVGSGDGTSFTVPAGYNDGVVVADTPTPTPDTATPAKKASNGSLGGATGFAAAATIVGGSIAAGSGVFSKGVAGVATAVPSLLAGSSLGTVPQSCSTTGATPLQLAQLIPQLKNPQPHWSATTFKSLPAPTKDGSVKLGGKTIAWKAGQPVADIVHIGDTDGSFNLHCLGLSKLAAASAVGVAAKPLSTLNLVADTSLQGLSKTLYIRAQTVGDVKGLSTLLASKSNGELTAEQLEGMRLSDVLKANPTLASLPLGAMPLNQVPGYSDLLLGDIPNWSGKAVSQVLGLASMPFSQFPVQPKPLNAFK